MPTDDLLECRLDGSDTLYLGIEEELSIFSPNRYILKRFPDSRTVSLERASRYLRAWPSGEIDWHAFSAEGWEEFLLLTSTDIKALMTLFDNEWIVPRTKIHIKKNDIVFAEGFRADVGPIKLNFRSLCPICYEKSAPNVMLLFTGGWIPEEIKLFKPLIFYVSFGSPKYLEMAAISMQTWRLFHDVEAKFLVISDLNKEEVLSKIPENLRRYSEVWTLQADETFEYCIQRYRIAEWPGIDNYQPILYLDTDVLFDADITQKLVELTLGDKIFVAFENGTEVAHTPSVGSQLVEQDPSFDGVSAVGFNSGTIGIPNAITHRVDLRAIAEVMVRYASLADGGRHALHWFDQACANYTLAKGAKVTGAFTETMSFVGHGETPQVPPRGLTHFWGAKDKLSTMEQYYNDLKK